jgi:hypothetical protein
VYRIREVDGDDEADTLAELHLATFKDIPVADFDDGYWWIVYLNDAQSPLQGSRSRSSESAPDTSTESE